MGDFVNTLAKIEPITAFAQDPGGAFSSKERSLHSLTLLAQPLDPGTGAIMSYLTMPDDEEYVEGMEVETTETTSTTTETPAETAAKEEERKKMAKKANRRKTILTGSQGLLENAPVEKKTLLGQ